MKVFRVWPLSSDACFFFFLFYYERCLSISYKPAKKDLIELYTFCLGLVVCIRGDFLIKLNSRSTIIKKIQ